MQHFFHDSLGSITNQIDDHGNQIGIFSYDTFGKPIPPKGGEHKYRYTSRRHDNDTGLYYYRSRWYMPDVGRFISHDVYPPDPFSTQSLNPYSYVQNNPLRWVDPHGKMIGEIAFGVTVITAYVLYKAHQYLTKLGQLTDRIQDTNNVIDSVDPLVDEFRYVYNAGGCKSGDLNNDTFVSPGNFTNKDMAFGISGTNHLLKFAGNAWMGTDVKIMDGEDMVDAWFRKMEEIVDSGGKLRFSLKDFNVAEAFKRGSDHYDSYTSQEIRHIFSNPKLLKNTVFYDQFGNIVTEMIIRAK